MDRNTFIQRLNQTKILMSVKTLQNSTYILLVETLPEKNIMVFHLGLFFFQIFTPDVIKKYKIVSLLLYDCILKVKKGKLPNLRILFQSLCA